MTKRNHLILSVLLIGFSILYQQDAKAADPLISFTAINTTALIRPIAITNAGDGSGRLFVTQQGGQILIYDGVNFLSTAFLDINSKISCCGEQGLLSVAFDPNYATNGFFYVDYTAAGLGTLTVERYHVSADPNIADDTSATPIISIPHPNFANHNGGQLQFGPDGFLYISAGDGGSGGDPDENAQNLMMLLGKILRIDVHGALPYTIPASNPFKNNPNAKPEIWAFGLRNPWRFSFDKLNGDLFIGDVGQNCWEEVDFRPHTSSGGENYGWDQVEGPKCYDEPSGNNCNLPPTCNMSNKIKPIVFYSHTLPDVQAVTGGYRYRGAEMPSLYGVYFYADYASGQIWGASQSGNGWTSTELANTDFFIPCFGQDEAGELYVSDLSAGFIYKISVPSSLPYADDFEDNDASDWTFDRGTWTVTGGNLQGTSHKKATEVAPFAGCTLCTIETDVTIVSESTKVSVLGWYRDKKNSVELAFYDKKNKIEFIQKSHGKSVAKQTVSMAVDTGVNYHVKMTYDGTQFQVFLNADVTPLFTMPSGALPIGGVAYRVKSATASFMGITVN